MLHPYLGAINAVIESIAKIVAAGGNLGSIKLSFQGIFWEAKRYSRKMRETSCCITRNFKSYGSI